MSLALFIISAIDVKFDQLNCGIFTIGIQIRNPIYLQIYHAKYTGMEGAGDMGG